ncbi:hypothetical protein I4F81_005072 [Pyropia yezoensis]|uniref:Uncharacterized protein n=1 Tax=Pyropia yezoensis TaxID=2788 RepID=A0ACC3BWU1_PYRYE|nr:hypothetical protein I4F81_005072 [Neopyropia yezoensis]
MLTGMHGMTAERVMATLTLWCQRRKTVLVLDAWENVSHHHIVNLLAITGDKAVLLESVYCGDECQDAEGQARLLQEKLVSYGGLTSFNAVGSDNAAACLEMRRLVTANNPRLVSLNDQAHVGKLLLGNLCKISGLKDVVQTAVTISAYAARESQAAFLRIAESATDARDWAALCQLLDPLCEYWRLFYGEGMRLSLVLPATRKLQADTAGMEAKLRAAGAAGTVSPAVFQQVCAAVQKRVSGPLDRWVRVPLLTDVHYLAAALDPKVLDPQAPDASLHVERSFEAIRVHFLLSPHVFSAEQLTGLTDDQRMLLLREDFTQAECPAAVRASTGAPEADVRG